MDPLNWRCRTPIENDDIPASYVPKDPGSPNLRWWARGVFPSPPKRKVFRFHETILSFGEPGSLGVSLLEGTEAEAQAEAHGFSEWMVFGPIPWATEALDAPRRPGLQDGRASEGVICMERLGCFPSNTSIKDPRLTAITTTDPQMNVSCFARFLQSLRLISTRCRSGKETFLDLW